MKMLRNRCHYTCIAVLVLAALLLTLGGATAAAQSAGAGTINGSISDASAAVIPGATVTLTNTDTGISHDYTTNQSGLYNAAFLLPGHYKISATAANFGKVEANGLTLIVGQVLTINLSLKVSTGSTTVEVNSENEILDTQKTEVSQVMDQHLVENLPINARNWSSFVLLTPNVTQDGTSV